MHCVESCTNPRDLYNFYIINYITVCVNALMLVLYLSHMPSKQHRERTYARNRTVSRRGYEKLYESDSRYFLKLVLCIVLGTLWLKFSHPLSLGVIQLSGIPIGMLFGLLFVSKFETYQSDRKIWYLVLVLVTIISYFLPAGIVI